MISLDSVSIDKDTLIELINCNFKFAQLYCKIIVKHPIILKNMVEFEKFKNHIHSLGRKKYILIDYCLKSFYVGANDEYFINKKFKNISRENFDLLINIFNVDTDINARIEVMRSLLLILPDYPSLKQYVHELIAIGPIIITPDTDIDMLTVSPRSADPETFRLLFDNIILNRDIDLNNLFSEALKFKSPENAEYIMSMNGFVARTSDLQYILHSESYDILNKWLNMVTINTISDFEEMILDMGHRFLDVRMLEKIIEIFNIDIHQCDKMFIIDTIFHNDMDIFIYFVDRGVIDLNEKYEDKTITQHVSEYFEIIYEKNKRISNGPSFRDKKFAKNQMVSIINQLIKHPTFNLQDDDIPILSEIPSIEVQRFLRNRS